MELCNLSKESKEWLLQFVADCLSNSGECGNRHVFAELNSAALIVHGHLGVSLSADAIDDICDALEEVLNEAKN